jgi:AbrB family looped-hinge helix DNA binding protein
MSVTIDKAGRFVLPKNVREQLGLSPGDELELTLSEDAVTIRAKPKTPLVKRVNGRWVCTAKLSYPDEAMDTLERVRNERARRLMGLDD